MKILWLSTGTINCEPIINGLQVVAKPDWDIRIHNYFDNPQIDVDSFKPDKILAIGAAGPKAINAMHQFHNSVLICFDGACPDWQNLLLDYERNETFTNIINIDGNDNWTQQSNCRVRYLTTVAPIDPRPFEVIHWRDIGCGFCGGWESPGRYELFSYLKSKGLCTVRTQIDSYFTYAEYALFMKRCNIVINANQSGGGGQQVKARVIEAGLAGAALLEPKGSITSKWLKPGVDYLEYDSPEDAGEKIKYLQNKYIELGKYQSNLAYRVKSDYSARKFWEMIL